LVPPPPPGARGGGGGGGMHARPQCSTPSAPLPLPLPRGNRPNSRPAATRAPCCRTSHKSASSSSPAPSGTPPRCMACKRAASAALPPRANPAPPRTRPLPPLRGLWCSRPAITSTGDAVAAAGAVGDASGEGAPTAADGDAAGVLTADTTGLSGLETSGTAPGATPAVAAAGGRPPPPPPGPLCGGAAETAAGAARPTPSRGAGGAGASTGGEKPLPPASVPDPPVGDAGRERSLPSPLVRADSTSAAYLSVLAAASMPGDSGAARGDVGGVWAGDGMAATAAAACAVTLGAGLGAPKSACSCARW
jgi:hypothetical protein